ncbi:MAG: 3-hydroxyacyl-CoA dehydrogenase family protein [Suipraeoptans sp.]
MKIGIIGAGTMGQGIAQAFASKENEIILSDITMELANSGLEKINSRDHSKHPLLGTIKAGLVEDVKDCDLVVEAIIEVMKVKEDLFKKLDSLCDEKTIFATNTSSLSITEISSVCKREVIGMHFFNPAPVMKLVEVIHTDDTPKELVEKIKDIAASIGKTPVEVAEGPGFVVNRILIPMINEAVGIYASGTASIEDIDTAMKLGANHPIGPLALGDLIGLDVCLEIMEVLQSETGDPKYRPELLLRKMVRAGKLGRKTKQGFYKY